MEMGKIGSFVKSDVFVTPMKCLFWMNAWIKVFISSCGKGGFWSRTLIIKARFESIKKSNIPIKVIIVSAAVKKEDRKMLLIKYKNYNDLPLLARWLIFEKGILHAYYIYYYLFSVVFKDELFTPLHVVRSQEIIGTWPWIDATGVSSAKIRLLKIILHRSPPSLN